MAVFPLQVYAWVGFAVAVVWIYSIANEIVNLLQVSHVMCGCGQCGSCDVGGLVGIQQVM